MYITYLSYNLSIGVTLYIGVGGSVRDAVVIIVGHSDLEAVSLVTVTTITISGPAATCVTPVGDDITIAVVVTVDLPVYYNSKKD